MTYCLGWRTDDTAYLVADSAVTSAEALTSPHTTFGERHHHDEKRSVEERAMKIFELNRAVVTFAGAEEIGREFVRIVNTVLKGGEAPQIAFQTAANSILSDSGRPSISAMMATFEDGTPKLLAFNKDYDGRVLECRKCVQFGIVGPDHTDYVRSLISIAQARCPRPEAQLAAVLGNIQSFSVRDYTLERRGIGGAFTGLYVNQKGISWQPDLCFILVSDAVLSGQGNPNEIAPAIISIVRDNILLVRSQFAGGSIAFTNSPDKSIDVATIKKRAQAMNVEIERIENQLEFDYVVLIHTIRPIVAIVAMHKETHTTDLGLSATSFSASESLTRFLRGEQCQNAVDPHTRFFGFK